MFLRRLFAILPTPVMKFIDPSIDKEGLAFSSGDFYAYLTKGEVLEGYSTGSAIGDGFAIMGALYVPTLICLILLKFILLDGFVKRDSKGSQVFSAVIIFSIWGTFMNGILDESVSAQITRLVRDLPESILLYYVTFKISRILVRTSVVWRSERIESRFVRRL
jgi:hypothetical protein